MARHLEVHRLVQIVMRIARLFNLNLKIRSSTAASYCVIKGENFILFVFILNYYID